MDFSTMMSLGGGGGGWGTALQKYDIPMAVEQVSEHTWFFKTKLTYMRLKVEKETSLFPGMSFYCPLFTPITS